MLPVRLHSFDQAMRTFLIRKLPGNIDPRRTPAPQEANPSAVDATG
jgi:hypothetical protein